MLLQSFARVCRSSRIAEAFDREDKRGEEVGPMLQSFAQMCHSNGTAGTLELGDKSSDEVGRGSYTQVMIQKWVFVFFTC